MLSDQALQVDVAGAGTPLAASRFRCSLELPLWKLVVDFVMAKKFRSASFLILVLFSLVSRFPFLSRMPFGLDSIQYVLGLMHYDVRLHQPHPPGYFLFVMAGKVANFAVGDPNRSFVALNVVFSALCVWVVFELGAELFGKESGLSSAVLLATSPTFWFHGAVDLSNLLDCLLVSCLALLCWRITHGL